MERVDVYFRGIVTAKTLLKSGVSTTYLTCAVDPPATREIDPNL